MNSSDITLSLSCFGAVEGEGNDDDDDDEMGRRPVRVADADSFSSMTCLRRVALQSRHTGAALCRKRVRMIDESIVFGDGDPSLILLV